MKYKIFMLIAIILLSLSLIVNYKLVSNLKYNGWQFNVEQILSDEELVVIRHTNNSIVATIFKNSSNQQIKSVNISSTDKEYSIVCNVNRMHLTFDQNPNNEIKRIVLYDGNSKIRKPTHRVFLEKINNQWQIVKRESHSFNAECEK